MGVVTETFLHIRGCAQSVFHLEKRLQLCWIHNLYMESAYLCEMTEVELVEDTDISAYDQEKHCWEKYCSKH